MALFCIISANSGSFRAHCVKFHVRYLISWWVLVSLCQLTSLTIHNSLSLSFSLSLPAQDLPLSQTWPRTDSANFLTDRFFWASRFFVFTFFITLSSFGLVPCGRLSWLFASLWTHTNIVYRIISYRNILRQSYSVWRLTAITTSNVIRRQMLRAAQHLGS